MRHHIFYRMSTNRKADFVLRAVIGAILAISGGTKLAGLRYATSATVAYLHMNETLMAGILILISLLQIYLGVGIVFRGYHFQRLAAWITVILSSFLIGMDLARLILYPLYDCGCFGPLSRILPGWISLAVAGLLLMFVILWCLLYFHRVSVGLLSFLTIFSITIGSMSVNVLNNVPLYGHLRISRNESLRDWYGVSAHYSYTGISGAELSRLFKQPITVKERGDNPFVRQVYDVQGSLIGRLLSWQLPTPRSSNGLINLGLVIDEIGNPLELTMRRTGYPPMTAQEEMEWQVFRHTFLTIRTQRFFEYGISGLRIPCNDEMGILIVDAINNAYMNMILLQE